MIASMGSHFSFSSELASDINRFLPFQIFSHAHAHTHTRVWSGQIAERQETHPLLRVKIIFLAK